MLDRTIPPETGIISTIAIQEAESYFLDNGIPVHIISSGNHDIIHAEVICKSGKWYEPENGISFFSSKMLLEGTSKKSSGQIAAYFELYGAHVSISSSLELVSISVYTLKSNLNRIFKFLRDCILEASYPAEELLTLKSIQREHIKVQNEKSNYLASKEFKASVFGSHHPYGRSLEEEDINAIIERGKVYNYYQHFLLNGMEIIISGNIGQKERNAIKVFSLLPIEHSNNVDHIPVAQKAGSFMFNDDKRVQSSIRYGNTTISKSNPDIHGLTIVNEILGGFFGSRLMKNIREDKGYTYGIFSSIVNHLYGSYFVIGADVKKEFREATVHEINLEINRMKSELVSQEELDTVKNYLLGAFLSSMETSFSLADKFKEIYFYGLDYAFYNRYIDSIRTITPGQIIELSNKYLNQEEFNLVVVE